MRVETIVPLDDWRAVGDAAKRAEALGFDGVFTSEIAHDPFIPLAFAALASERLSLSTGIAVCFPRSPMVTANLAWDLQAQSGGRFRLGLGTQVKGHNERRFSVPWSPPIPRLREYMQALRAIWRTWETGERLAFEGEHYQFSLMTPEFAPKPSGQPPVPITIAAVNPGMMGLAGRVADGVSLHFFATRRYLEKVAMPRIEEGLAEVGRPRSTFGVWGGRFIATGPDEATVKQQIEWARYRIAFYGSTRTYHRVLAEHGWEDLGLELHEMSKKGQWKDMASRVTDEVIREFVAVGTYDTIAGEIEKHLGGLSDAIVIDSAPGTPEGPLREVVQDIQRIPTPFEGFALAY